MFPNVIIFRTRKGQVPYFVSQSGGEVGEGAVAAPVCACSGTIVILLIIHIPSNGTPRHDFNHFSLFFYILIFSFRIFLFVSIQSKFLCDILYPV